MDNNRSVGINVYSITIQQITSLLNLSLSEIRQKYISYPHCLIDYFEKETEDKSIEIRFDQEEFTITCLFNEDSKCTFVYLFIDKYEFIEGLISFLKDTYDYDFIKNRWKEPTYYIQVKEISHLPNDICLMFYSIIQ